MSAIIGSMLSAMNAAVSAVYGNSRMRSSVAQLGRWSTSASWSTSGSTKSARVSAAMMRADTAHRRARHAPIAKAHSSTDAPARMTPVPYTQQPSGSCGASIDAQPASSAGGSR